MDNELYRLSPGEALAYHRRQAGRLRDLAEEATTAAMRARLLGEAERHEHIAQSEIADAEEPSAMIAEPAR